MSEAKTAVLIRTRHPFPDPTELSHAWAGVVKQQFEANNWQVIDLSEDNVTASQVKSALQDTKSEVVIFYGHGFPSCMIAQNREEAVVNLDNITLLKDKKVYVMACWTAQKLGEEAENIARCYLGYDQEVFVWFEHSDCFGESVNQGLVAMLKNSTCTYEQAKQQMIAKYDYWIDHFYDNNFALAADLRHNRDALRLFGDIGAKL
jgi:hypothetical protein